MRNSDSLQEPRKWADKVINYYQIQDFPINLEDIILDYTSSNYEDPITKIIKNEYEGFEGALCPSQKGNKKWCIVYNSAVQNQGRINFTIAHEFGHYLMHRNEEPEGIACHEKDGVYTSSKYKNREDEADAFAKNLLIPKEAFCKKIGESKLDFSFFQNCSDYYQVSLTALVIRWIEVTYKRAVVIASHNNKVIWSFNSNTAKKSGIFFFKGKEIPEKSLTYKILHKNIRSNINSDSSDNIWRTNDKVEEYVIGAGNYNYTLTLLVFEDIKFNNNFKKHNNEWNDEEESNLYYSFIQNAPISVLACNHHRSEKAIEMRLERLGLSNSEENILGSKFTPFEMNSHIIKPAPDLYNNLEKEILDVLIENGIKNSEDLLAISFADISKITKMDDNKILRLRRFLICA